MSCVAGSFRAAPSSTNSKRSVLAHLEDVVFCVSAISAGKWQPIRGVYEQRDSNVGGAPVLSTCCSCCSRNCMLVGRCLVPDISHSGAQDAQGKPGPATASGAAYGEKENGGSASAAAPARAQAGKAVEDGATALLRADISVRPCTSSAAAVPCCQSFHACTLRPGLQSWSASARTTQEGEEEKLLAPESAAEEEERLRQHRKQETERALQVTP